MPMALISTGTLDYTQLTYLLVLQMKWVNICHNGLCTVFIPEKFIMRSKCILSIIHQ